MVIVEKTLALLCLGVSIETAPLDDVVFVLLVELKLRVNVIIDDFLAAAVLQILRPSRVNFEALYVMVIEWVVMDHKARSLVNIVACCDAEENDHDYGIDPRRNY